MGGLKETLTKIKILYHSLFYGLKAADATIQSQTSGENGLEINEQVKPGGVFNDMLEQRVTKDVEEMRDKYYRVLREADKYTAGGMTLTEDADGNLTFSGGVKKKTKADFMKHPPVFEKEGSYVRVIQDNKHYEKERTIENIYVPKGIYDYDTTLNLKRDFIPRFEIEKFAKKIVVRCKENSQRADVDLYLPAEASQFGKIDAILISNLYTLLKEKTKNSDITDIKEIEFYTDKAWNCEDVCIFKFDDVKYSEINVFDGNFVLTFDCNIVENGKDLAEKYKTKELDDKYEKKAPKKETTDLSAILRKNQKEEKNKSKIDIENIGDSTIKITL